MSIVSRVRRSEQSLAKPVVASTVANQRAPVHKSWSRSNCGGPAATQRHSAACRSAHHRHNPLAELISRRVPHWVTAAPAWPATMGPLIASCGRAEAAAV